MTVKSIISKYWFGCLSLGVIGVPLVSLGVLSYVSSPESLEKYSYLNLIPAITIIVSTMVAAIFAKLTIDSNRQTKRKSETIQFIMNRSRDREFFEAFSVIRTIDRDNGLDIRFFSQKRDFENELKVANSAEKIKINNEWHQYNEGLKNLQYLLNQFEYMSVAIKNGVYDESILKAATRSSTVVAYQITSAYIDSIRKDPNRPKANQAYVEFEKLAKRWL